MASQVPQMQNMHSEKKMSDLENTREDRRRGATVYTDLGAASNIDMIPGMTKEYSGWDVYNNEAKKVDTELIRDWRESLNSLLLFAAIFAAVLTAFIIESKKMLEQDPTDVMVDVLIFYTNSMANGSHTPYSRTAFEADSYAVTINCLLYASLSTSLVAALASVISLQWIADYDAAITRGGSSPEDRAKRRQFRFAGVMWWKMGEIIAALPLLLYCSVGLFFVGLILWMWSIHRTVGIVVAGGAGLAVLFYGISTLLSVIFVSAPFRTPLSRWIYSFIRFGFSVIYVLARALHIPSIPTWLENQRKAYTISQRREDQEVSHRTELAMDALVWLANQLSVSQDSYDRLLLVASELPKLASEHFASPAFWNAPWFLIFDLLGWKNLKPDSDPDVNEHDMHAFAVLAECYRMPIVRDIIVPNESTIYSWNEKSEEYWSQYCEARVPQWSSTTPSTHPNSLFLLLRDIPLPSSDMSHEIELTIWFSRWRNSQKISQEQNMPSSTALVPTNMADKASFTREWLDSWLARDDVFLYNKLIDRILPTLVNDNGQIPPTFLDLLRWKFEQILLGNNKEISSSPSCLSWPLHYKRALWHTTRSRHYNLHAKITLLLARNLDIFTEDDKIYRIKEVIIMLWVLSLPHNDADMPDSHRRQGIEEFFESDKAMIMEWIKGVYSVPHLVRILGYLSTAQAETPKIGPLWRVGNAQGDNEPHFVEALDTFGSLIFDGVTASQHCMLVGLVCHDIESLPVGSFKDYFNNARLRVLSQINDPCLQILGNYMGGLDISNICLEVDFTGRLKNSWARLADHFLRCRNNIDSESTIASLWSAIPNQANRLYTQALSDPNMLSYLKRVFHHPIRCSQHDHGEGHLLLHLFDQVPSWRFPVDLEALIPIPLQRRKTNALLLSLVFISTENQELLAQNLRFTSMECAKELFGMLESIAISQFTRMSLLHDLRDRLVIRGVYSEELAAVSVCINKALDMPWDQRTTLIVHPLVACVLFLKDAMIRSACRAAQENEVASMEAGVAVNRLQSCLAREMIFGAQNVRLLACARTTGNWKPAVGWLPPHVD